MALYSTEHTAAITAKITYKVTLTSDAFVRVYDKVLAQRDEPWLVERKHITNKSPEDVQRHFALKFVPRFVCDASVPIGEAVTMATLTNESGETVRIFRADTRLLLSGERALSSND